MARRLPVPRQHLGLPRGRNLLPGFAGDDRRGLLRRGRHPRNGAAQRLQLRLGGGVGRLPDDRHGGRSSMHRDGISADQRDRRRRRRPGGLHRRVRGHVQPRGGTPLRRPDPRNRGAQLHPAARHRGRGVRRPDRGPRREHDPAGRHLRHRGGRADRCRTHPGTAGRDPARLGRSGRAGHRCAAPARLAGRHQHQDHRHLRPRRVADRGTARRPGRRVRGRHLAGHRLRCPVVWVRVQAGGPGRQRRARRAARTGRQEEPEQVEHRRPQVRAAPAGRPGQGRGRGDRGGLPARRRSQRPAAAGRTGPRRRDRRPGTAGGRSGPARPFARRVAAGRTEDVEGRGGDPDADAGRRRPGHPQPLREG